MAVADKDQMGTTREALSDITFFLLVVIGALATDGVLHLLDLAEWGRYFGYIGTGLILLSFLHSARKRKKISIGSPVFYLRIHEFLAWLGSMMVLVHAGIHFNAILPWAALIAMLVTVASGLTGKFLLKKSSAIVAAQQRDLQDEGASASEIKEHLFWDSLVVDLMRKWRVVHLPITSTFLLLAALHIVSVLIFWRW